MCANVTGGIIFFTYFCTVRTTKRFSGGSRSATLTSTTVRDRGLRQHLGDLVGEDVDRDQPDGAAVGELVRHLRRRCRAGWCSPSPARP